MTLVEAIRSGKRFNREPSVKDSGYYFRAEDFFLCYPTIEDLEASDYVLAPNGS